MKHSPDASSPSGEASRRRALMQPALDSDLMRRVVDSKNVAKAWEQVRRNQGAPGVDGISIEEFAAYGRQHWIEIRRALLDGTYRPAPVRQKAIPKPTGGERCLGSRRSSTA